MAFVTQYKHDIFVSYAHVDNQPLNESTKGWVTSLVDALKIQLDKKLGRRDAYDLWIDHNLSRHVQITSQIMAELRETATIIVVLSPAYVESEWCQREREVFLDFIKERDRAGSRVFVVEHDMVEDDRRPNEFKHLLGYPFWVKERDGKPPRILGFPIPTQDQRYYDLINDLSHDLSRELQRLKNIERIDNRENVPGDSPAVFLAEVTDDLEPQRDDVKRYLDQHGLRVIPDSLYPREPDRFQKMMENDLGESKLFVQLLSDIVGKKAPGSSSTYARLQYECAVQSGKPILQWCGCDLDISKITVPEHQALLGLDTVMAVGIEEFKDAIVKQAFYKPQPSRGKAVNAFVFVNMETSDRSLATRVCEYLDNIGAEYALPIQGGKPGEIREDLEQNLLDCDGMIVVYGKTTVMWVREQLRQCRKILARREYPIKALAVYEGPPEPKVPLDLKLKNMQVINCRKGLEDNELKCFFEALRQGE